MSDELDSALEQAEAAHNWIELRTVTLRITELEFVTPPCPWAGGFCVVHGGLIVKGRHVGRAVEEPAFRPGKGWLVKLEANEPNIAYALEHGAKLT